MEMARICSFLAGYTNSLDVSQTFPYTVATGVLMTGLTQIVIWLTQTNITMFSSDLVIACVTALFVHVYMLTMFAVKKEQLIGARCCLLGAAVSLATLVALAIAFYDKIGNAGGL